MIPRLLIPLPIVAVAILILTSCCYWVVIVLLLVKMPNLIQNQSVVLKMVTLEDDPEETVPITPRVAFVLPGYYYLKHCQQAIAVAGVAHAVAVLLLPVQSFAPRYHVISTFPVVSDDAWKTMKEETWLDKEMATYTFEH